MKRFISLFLGVLSVVCYALVYQRPLWTFNFKAPQYPQGLQLQIYMTKTEGDVSEIDIINHYIGMQKLEEAAGAEKAMAPFILIALSLLALLIGAFPDKRIMRFLSLPILMFPLVFAAIFYYWLYKFGHDLDPAAPMRLAPFTPAMMGTGLIGQFSTYALPGMGFYLSCLPVLLVMVILKYNKRS